MNSLSRKLARLEIQVQAQQPPASTFWTPARVEAYRIWAVRLLESMPAARGAVVYAELTLPADQWGPVARRVDRMACLGADGLYDATTWPYWSERVIALPEAICEVLERHPDATYTRDFSCEDCGLEMPHLPKSGALLSICPPCTGEVSWAGCQHRRYRDDWEQPSAVINIRGRRRDVILLEVGTLPRPSTRFRRRIPDGHDHEEQQCQPGEAHKEDHASDVQCLEEAALAALRLDLLTLRARPSAVRALDSLG
jgi:hypothetical protein